MQPRLGLTIHRWIHRIRRFPLHLLRVVWTHRISWFWPIWITLTVAVALGTAWVVGQGPSEARTVITPSQRRVWSPSTAVALAVLALLLAGYMADTLKWENFTNDDDGTYTVNTLRGIDYPPAIWVTNGRFRPLYDQEFNVIRHFTSSVVGYHVLPLTELLIFACLLLVLDEEMGLTARAILATFVLVTPGAVISFTGLTYSERNLLLCLAGFLICMKQFDKTLSTGWAVGAAVAAQVMVNHKETAFLLVWGFAIGRLVLRCRRKEEAGWDFSRLRGKESRLDLCLISVGVLFLLYYGAAIGPSWNMGYAETQASPLPDVLAYYMKTDLLIWLLAVTLGIRLYLILRRKTSPMAFWDTLAAGGVVYFLAYLVLRLAEPYYMAPVDLIAVLYLGRMVILHWGEMRAWSRAVTAAIALATLMQGASLSVFCEFERKNMIHAKGEMADVIVARFRNAGGDGLQLYFPFAQPFPLSEFAAYLSYRGVPVEEEVPGKPGIRGGVRLVQDRATDGLCVSYQNFVCHAASEPKPGDLVIEMPDDSESAEKMNRYRNGGTILWAYEPIPNPPPWLHRLEDYFRAPTPSGQRHLSAGWLRASVIEWK